MPVITCPLCRNAVTLASATAGETATCPACGGAFAIPANSGITAETPRSRDQGIAEGMPAGHSRFDDDDLDIGTSRWQTTGTGLTLIWWSVLALFILAEAMSATMVAMPIDPANFGQPQTAALAIVMGGFGCVAMVAYVVGFVGMCLCCTAPDASARSRVIASIVSLGLCVLAGVGAGIAIGVKMAQLAQNQQQLPGNQPGDPLAFLAAIGTPATIGLAIAVVLALVATVAWLLFHAAVGQAFSNPPLRRLAWIVLGIWLVSMPINWVSAYLPQIVLDLEPAQQIRLQHGVSLILALAIYIPYLLLCARTIDAIRAGQPAADGDR